MSELDELRDELAHEIERVDALLGALDELRRIVTEQAEMITDLADGVMTSLGLSGEIVEAIRVDRQAILALYSVEQRQMPLFDALPELPTITMHERST